MRIIIGTGLIALLVVGIIACPAQVQQQARDVATIPPEVQAEMSRQLSVFTAVMEGERPDLQPRDSQ
ncbi:MAG: hypothetical protein DHS20C06_07760 [Hyphobacterium sp.]|nr:MAG: hypothetical protein DHS20C06_07760 [Hyphobacterium sp.]